MDATGFEVIEQRQQVFGVASQAIQFPHHDFIAVLHLGQQFIELRSACLGATYRPVGEYLGAAGGIQCLELEVRGLALAADSGVSVIFL